MRGIIVETSLSTDASTSPADGVRMVELGGLRRAGGPSGDVYDLAAVDGMPPPRPRLVTVLPDGGGGGFATVHALQRRMRADDDARRAAGEPPLHAVPALRALPRLSFRGRMDGEAVCGWVEDDVEAEGYLPLARILDPEGEEGRRLRGRYTDTLAMEDRLALAYELAEGLDALRRLSFVHGDLGPACLHVHVEAGHLALTGFDRGAVEDAGAAPSAVFSRTEEAWAAPERLDPPSAEGGDPSAPRADRYADDWAAAVGIHYLLLLCRPFFLLRHAGGAELRDHAARFGWPAYDAADPLFTPGLAASHQRWTELLRDLPAPVLRGMTETFAPGARDPRRRTSPHGWMVALKGAREALEIVRFHAEPEAVVEGRPVRLTWEVAGARRVEIEGIGEVEAAGSRDLAATAAGGGWTLTAEARDGRRLAETVAVTVVPLPRLETLFVPAPELSCGFVLRGVHVAAPTVRMGAPAAGVAAPSLHLAAPSIRVPVTLDLTVHLPAGRGVAPPDAAPGTAWVRTDGVPRAIDVFHRLYDEMKSEITAWYGGSS